MTYNYYISSIKKPYLFCGKLCAVTFIIFLFSVQVFAQTHLQRISNSARSDGLGYVVRYHLTAPVDSFDLIQPASDLVQMVLYGTDIDTSGILLPEKSEKLKEVRLYKLEYGYGVDIYLSEDAYYLSTAYLDQNKSHILLALTETTQREAERYSQQFIARNWYREIIPEDALEVTGVEVNPFDDSYNIIKDKLRFDRIVIDPGHGGHDPGNPGYNNSVKEKDIVLSIAKKLGSYIEEHLPGVEVIYTRENDEFVALEERGRIANRAVADLFVSIHADAFPNHQVRGASVFFLGLNRSDMSFEIMKKENQVYQNELVEDLTEEDLLV
ncbi:MAG: N-acetylmuramoyl-L-alanine amidase, partial [Balneolaceae bacterium]